MIQKETFRTYQKTKEQKKVEHKGNSDTICSGCTWNDLQSLGEMTGLTGNQRTNRDYLDHNIVDLVWFLGFNGISIFIGYLMPNPSF